MTDDIAIYLPADAPLNVTVPTEDPITVTSADDAFRISTLSTDSGPPISIKLSDGEQGPPGSVDLTVNVVNSATDTVIDYAKGTWQRLVLSSDVQTLTVVNWPDATRAARLVLEIENTGSFRVYGWPQGTRWPADNPPINTANATDLVVLSTGSGGASVFGSVVGQNFTS